MFSNISLSFFGKVWQKVYLHFTEIHRSLLEKVELIKNRPITTFYNIDDVNVIAAEFGKIKRDQWLCKWYINFYIKQKVTGVNTI